MPPHPSLLASRLQLAPFRGEDARAIYSFIGDPVAMKFTYVAPTLEACTARLQAWESRRAADGYAPWVIRSHQQDVIGWGGLGIEPEAPHWGAEVIYAFHPSAWGLGYATELVRHSLRVAFAELALTSVAAFAHPQNAASLAVLRKCSGKHVGFVPALHREHFRFTKET
jgi:ribosomal-protein-alanine N-acetyltransferase